MSMQIDGMEAAQLRERCSGIKHKGNEVANTTHAHTSNRKGLYNVSSNYMYSAFKTIENILSIIFKILAIILDFTTYRYLRKVDIVRIIVIIYIPLISVWIKVYIIIRELWMIYREDAFLAYIQRYGYPQQTISNISKAVMVDDEL